MLADQPFELLNENLQALQLVLGQHLEGKMKAVLEHNTPLHQEAQYYL